MPCSAVVALSQPPASKMASHARAAGESSGFGARSVDVVDFVGARVSELRALRSAIVTTPSNSRVYQSLAWHRRRRTMSHTSYRVPARLRAAHARELATSASPGSARDGDGMVVERAPGPTGRARCRKYRRRVRYLDAIREWRKRSLRWLETHVWHAKRFLMVERGGRLFAERPSDRGLRSGYRAVEKCSLVHDGSYLDVVEIVGEGVGELLKVCLGREDGVRAVVGCVRRGLRRVERLVVIDGEGRAVGPVDLLWRPGRTEKDEQVWLWCYPETTEGVLEALEGKRGEGVKVRVLELGERVLTFSVVGPRACAVLAAVFHRVQTGSAAEWDTVGKVSSSACLPHGCLLAMEVEDPRASFPPKRTGDYGRGVGSGDTAVTKTLHSGFQSVDDSRLWDREARVALRGAAKKVGKKPGSNGWGDVPVVCLQRASGSSAVDGGGGEFGSGWDVLVPAGWGMAFWISLLYANGGRAAGQRELRHIALEAGIPVFPEDYQDSIAGAEAVKPVDDAVEEKFYAKPKAKRVNYNKYRIASPFRADLASLVSSVSSGESGGEKEEPSADEDSRASSAADKKPPLKRQRRIEPSPVAESSPAADAGIPGAEAQATLPYRLPHVVRSESEICLALLPKQSGATPLASAARLQLTGALIRVTLRPVSRGVPRRNAIIVLGSAADIEAAAAAAALSLSSTSRGNQPKGGGGDPAERLARGTKKCLPPTREVIGRVVHGDYVLSKGGSSASAVITVEGARKVLALEERDTGRREAPLWRGKVMFRNIDSMQYRWAVATVCVG